MPKVKVLIVDDEKDFASTLAERLSNSPLISLKISSL